MKKTADPKKEIDLKSLRKKAEKALKDQTARMEELSRQDAKRLVAELGTHQIELEIQNEELRQALTELDESRGRYADLYDFAPIGYFTFDARGLIRDVNQTGADLLGATKRLLLNKSFSRIIPDENDKRVFRMHCEEVFFNPARRSCEVKLKGNNNPAFTALLQSIAVNNDDGKPGFIRTSVTDISALKETEEALRSANEELKRRTSVAEANVRLKSDNEELSRLYGKSKELDTLKTQFFAQRLMGEQTRGKESRRSEERFRLFLESAPDGMVIVDDRHAIMMINNNFQHMTGYTREELNGKPIETLVPDGAVDAHVMWRDEYIKKPKARAMGEKRDLECCRKDGTRFPVEISLGPLETEDGIMVFTTIRDISERRKADSAQRLAAAVFANTTEGIVVTDAKGTIQSVNEAFVRITGHDAAEAVGNNMRILKSGMQDAAFYAGMWEALLKTGTWKGSFWNRRKNGELYPHETTINAISNDQGEIAQYCGIFRDITIQHKLEETLRLLSSTDGMTGLANRRSLDEAIVNEWRRAHRVGYPVALIMVDIDDFKKFNDTYGHVEGDTCLKRVATVFKNAVRRAGDLAARYGGEELALLLPMITADEAAQIAERIRSHVEAMQIPHRNSGTSRFVTLSLGVATVFPKQDVSAEELIMMADKALYQAKQEGKNRVKSIVHEEGPG